MLLGLAVGLAAGALAGLSRRQELWTIDPYVNSISAWLLVPFVVGALGGRAVLAGLAQMATFYLVTGSRDGVVFWLAAAVGGGLVFGAAGRRWRRGGAWALLAAVAAEVWSTQHLG